MMPGKLSQRNRGKKAEHRKHEQPSEALLQEFFNERIIPQLNRGNLWNTVTDTHTNRYLDDRAPDVSGISTGFVVSASSVHVVGDLKPPTAHGGFEDGAKGPVYSYVESVLAAQPYLTELTGFLTDTRSVIFISVSRERDSFSARYTEGFMLDKPTGYGNRLLRALFDKPHPRLCFEPIRGIEVREVTVLASTTFSSVVTVANFSNAVLKISARRDLVTREVLALTRLHDKAGIIRLECNSANAMLLTPRAAHTAEQNFSRELPRAAMAQIVTALRECHNAGVVHRDCRSSNILVIDSDRLILADFGCSCLADSGDVRHFMGAPAVFQSSHILAHGTFRAQDDLHILVRSLYALRGEIPETEVPAELDKFWSSRGRAQRLSIANIMLQVSLGVQCCHYVMSATMKVSRQQSPGWTEISPNLKVIAFCPNLFL